MKPLKHQQAHRAEGRRGTDERQEALVGLPAVALDEEKASRFLKALERPDGPARGTAPPSAIGVVLGRHLARAPELGEGRED